MDPWRGVAWRGVMFFIATMSIVREKNQILETLVKRSGKPVTCKIRVFDDMEQTLHLVKRLATTGIQAIAVHCRTVQDRPRDPGRWEYFRPIVDAVHIPVIANGDFFNRQEGLRMMSETGKCMGWIWMSTSTSTIAVLISTMTTTTTTTTTMTTIMTMTTFSQEWRPS